MLSLIGAMFLIDALLQVFPWYSALAVLTVVPVLLTLRKATGDLKHYLRLMAVNLRANLQAALLILLTLLLRGFTGI